MKSRLWVVVVVLVACCLASSSTQAADHFPGSGHNHAVAAQLARHEAERHGRDAEARRISEGRAQKKMEKCQRKAQKSHGKANDYAKLRRDGEAWANKYERTGKDNKARAAWKNVEKYADKEQQHRTKAHHREGKAAVHETDMHNNRTAAENSERLHGEAARRAEVRQAQANVAGWQPPHPLAHHAADEPPPPYSQ